MPYPRASSARGGCAKALRELLELLTDEVDGEGGTEDVANVCFDILQDFGSHHVGHAVEARASGVEDVEVHDGFATWTEWVELFQAPVPSRQTGGEHDERKAHA